MVSGHTIVIHHLCGVWLFKSFKMISAIKHIKTPCTHDVITPHQSQKWRVCSGTATNETCSVSMNIYTEKRFWNSMSETCSVSLITTLYRKIEVLEFYEWNMSLCAHDNISTQKRGSGVLTAPYRRLISQVIYNEIHSGLYSVTGHPAVCYCFHEYFFYKTVTITNKSDRCGASRLSVTYPASAKGSWLIPCVMRPLHGIYWSALLIYSELWQGCASVLSLFLHMPFLLQWHYFRGQPSMQPLLVYTCENRGNTWVSSKVCTSFIIKYSLKKIK